MATNHNGDAAPVVVAARVATSLSFTMQIGLVREIVRVELEGGDLTMATLKEIACAFVDRKVGCILPLEALMRLNLVTL